MSSRPRTQIMMCLGLNNVVPDKAQYAPSEPKKRNHGLGRHIMHSKQIRRIAAVERGRYNQARAWFDRRALSLAAVTWICKACMQ
jgi:hypothetical protein